MQGFPNPVSRLKLVLPSLLMGYELRTPVAYSFCIEQFDFNERSYK